MVPSLDKVTLRAATRDQEIESRKLTAVAWAKWYNSEEYLQHLEYLEKLDHAAVGRLITWVLVPIDDPHGLEVLSTCQTYRRDILVLPANETKLVSDIGYGIASVFTPEKYRGRGYAARMMSLLHFALAKPGGAPPFPQGWGKEPPTVVNEPGLVSVLYSGVGDYYSRCAPGDGAGWTITGTDTVEWVVPSDDDTNQSAKIAPGVEFLSMEDAIYVVTADAALVRHDLVSRAPSAQVHFAFQPTAGWCRYQMIRDQGCPLYLNSPPQAWGARVKIGNDTHFIVWTYRPRPDDARRLVVITLRASPEAFPVLLAATVSVARREKHHLVQAWRLNQSLLSIARETGGKIHERTEQLPALKWYGPEELSDVIWEGNNK